MSGHLVLFHGVQVHHDGPVYEVLVENSIFPIETFTTLMQVSNLSRLFAQILERSKSFHLLEKFKICFLRQKQVNYLDRKEGSFYSFSSFRLNFKQTKGIDICRRLQDCISC